MFTLYRQSMLSMLRYQTLAMRQKLQNVVQEVEYKKIRLVTPGLLSIRTCDRGYCSGLRLPILLCSLVTVGNEWG
ncbi:hypothetical protein T06_11400 [Trichinella sp. T6]|nr:hypothetical protein T06_11400 [Trichinella sp. T6]